MKKVFLLLAAAALVAGAVFACGSSSSSSSSTPAADDDASPVAPTIGHNSTNGSNCLAAGCHQGVHNGEYANDQCLNCHSYPAS
jgi:hypothetical protein